MSKKTKIEKILELWAAKQKTSKETLRDLTHEIENAIYHKLPIIPIEGRSGEYLTALLRETARKIED